jgi:hypothetical protein
MKMENDVALEIHTRANYNEAPDQEDPPRYLGELFKWNVRNSKN